MVDIQSIDFHESTSFGNLFKAGTYHGPTLFIHAEYDHLIPATEGQALYDVSPSTEKEILIISDADHNDILLRGWNDYFGAIQRLAGVSERSRSAIRCRRILPTIISRQLSVFFGECVIYGI